MTCKYPFPVDLLAPCSTNQIPRAIFSRPLSLLQHTSQLPCPPPTSPLPSSTTYLPAGSIVPHLPTLPDSTSISLHSNTFVHRRSVFTHPSSVEYVGISKLHQDCVGNPISSRNPIGLSRPCARRIRSPVPTSLTYLPTGFPLTLILLSLSFPALLVPFLLPPLHIPSTLNSTQHLSSTSRLLPTSRT